MKITTWNKIMCEMEAKKGQQVNIANMAEIFKNANILSKGLIYFAIKKIPELKTGQKFKWSMKTGK